MPEPTKTEKKPRAKKRNFSAELNTLRTYVSTKLEVLRELQDPQTADANGYADGQINALAGVLAKMDGGK